MPNWVRHLISRTGCPETSFTSNSDLKKPNLPSPLNCFPPIESVKFGALLAFHHGPLRREQVLLHGQNYVVALTGHLVRWAQAQALLHYFERLHESPLPGFAQEMYRGRS